jgi:hypothetical protein
MSSPHRFARFMGETMFPPWAPFFSADGAASHCYAEHVPLRDAEHGTCLTRREEKP